MRDITPERDRYSQSKHNYQPTFSRNDSYSN